MHRRASSLTLAEEAFYSLPMVARTNHPQGLKTTQVCCLTVLWVEFQLLNHGSQTQGVMGAGPVCYDKVSGLGLMVCLLKDVREGAWCQNASEIRGWCNRQEG